jgi:hypothetical protein
VDPRGGRQPARQHRQAAVLPCLKDEVTLACRIRRAGGDWTRDYAIADGDISIEALEANADKAVEWVGYRDYQSRLAWGGLTPAIAKVLALEQGDTDKLCEYSPKALLELVFDVFGDKEVLDNYAAAREEQNNAERELAALGLDLDRLRAQAEAKRLEADRYLEWKQLDDEALALAARSCPPRSGRTHPRHRPGPGRDRPQPQPTASRARTNSPPQRSAAPSKPKRPPPKPNARPPAARPRRRKTTSPPTTRCATSTSSSPSAAPCAPAWPARPATPPST